MGKYIDAKAREWDIKLTIGACKRIKQEFDFDIFKSDGESNAFLTLSGNYYLLIDVLWILCESQAKERGVSVEDFVEAFTGDAIDSCLEGVAIAYSDFIPNKTRRQTFQTLWAKIRDIEAKQLDKAIRDVTGMKVTGE